MESLVNVITSLPPEAVDRQRLLECLGNAEKNRIGGRMREASKWIMQVGATLHKKGGPAMPLAERVFQHAVHLAKQLDGENPQEFLLVEQEGNNPELGDAYTWLGATEAPPAWAGTMLRSSSPPQRARGGGRTEEGGGGREEAGGGRGRA